MASCLLNTESVELDKKLYKMTWWATAINQITVPSGMQMAGGSVAIITNSNGVESYHYNASTGSWKKDPAVEGGGGGDLSELENRVSTLEDDVDSIQEYVDSTSSDVESLIQSQPSYDSLVDRVGARFNIQDLSVSANSNKVITCPATMRSLAVVNGITTALGCIFIVTRMLSGTIRIVPVFDSGDVTMSANGAEITVTNSSSSYTAYVTFLNFNGSFTI